MPRRIFTTGMEILSPVDRKAEEVLYSLKNAGSGVVSNQDFKINSFLKTN
jgi:hypothetical protein